MRNRGLLLLLTGVLLLAPAGCAFASGSQDSENTQKDDDWGCDAGENSGACLPDEKREEEVPEGFREISFDEAIDLFQNGQDGLLYFGYPGCPWCEEVVPLLQEAAEKQNEEVLYVRTRDADRNRLYTDEQKDEITPWMKDWMSENEDGVLTLYVPVVAAVTDGKVAAAHVGTVDGHDAHERKMTEEETEQVREALENVVKSMKQDSAQ